MNVGIDLGTTYSLIARMDGDGHAQLLPDHSEHEVVHTPSVVHITRNTALVGRMVENLVEEDPGLKVIRYFKRHMGSPEPIYFDDKGTPWSAEAVSALVLKKLRFDAESHTSSTVDAAVITIPAHFNDPQRKAVLSAALMADLPVLGLVEEPVAAALHYGVKHGGHERVLLVYDFGGGTFDATALSMDESGVYVLAKTGITTLGGKELDDAVGTMILAQFERALGRPMTLSARTLMELRRTSEDIKIELCMPGRGYVRRVVLLGGDAVEVELSKADFHKAIASILDLTEAETLKCVSEAGLKPENIDSVLLVGGSSMVPVVADRMRLLFSRKGQSVLYHEPSKAVAFGAALRATQLIGDAEQYNVPPEFRGVTGHCVGVRTMDAATGRVTIDTLIRKNLPLPVRVKKTYFTTRANQERIVLDLVQYRDRPDGDGVVSLGQLVVGPLPSPRQNYPIDVTIECREDGTVAVQAYDAQTAVELEQVFGREGDGGFSQSAMQRALVRSTFINNVNA